MRKKKLIKIPEVIFLFPKIKHIPRRCQTPVYQGTDINITCSNYLYFLKHVIILADIMHNATSWLLPIQIQQQFSDTNFKTLFLRSLQSPLWFCESCIIPLCLQIRGEAEILISLTLSATGVCFWKVESADVVTIQ